MLLKNKVAVIYGASGAIGSAVAYAFASKGAEVFVTGRAQGPLDALAKSIVSGGGVAHAAVVDALDEKAVNAHLDAVLRQTDRLDVSFDAVGIPDGLVGGVPLLELPLERFAMPVAAYTNAYFITARAAARRMIPKKSGVVMTVTALPARVGTRLNGGYGAASAAKEALTRDLSCELAAYGIRVVGLRPHGMPETSSMKEVFDLKGPAAGMTWEQFQAYLAGTTHPKRVMKLAELAQAAAFVASDGASGLTGTTLNLTMGATSD